MAGLRRFNVAGTSERGKVAPTPQAVSVTVESIQISKFATPDQRRPVKDQMAAGADSAEDLGAIDIQTCLTYAYEVWAAAAIVDMVQVVRGLRIPASCKQARCLEGQTETMSCRKQQRQG